MTVFLGNFFGKYLLLFPGFGKFSISEDILKFTLFRNVLFPLNEKYSGLDLIPDFETNSDWEFYAFEDSFAFQYLFKIGQNQNE